MREMLRNIEIVLELTAVRWLPKMTVNGSGIESFAQSPWLVLYEHIIA
jgi:hypothetical protein